MEDTINSIKKKFDSSNNILSCIIDFKKIKGDFWKKINFKIDNNVVDYSRNIIFKNNDFELILIKWKKFSNTPIHIHPEKGCIMKLLEGELMEEKYYLDQNDKFIKYHEDKILKGKTCYIHNILGAHRIYALEDSYSLHLYSPPGFYNKSSNDKSNEDKN